jgi:hypothetical protein
MGKLISMAGYRGHTAVFIHLLSAAILLSSCQKSGKGTDHQPVTHGQNGNIITLGLPLEMTSGTADNIQIYMFNGLGQFARILLQVERDSAQLTARDVPAGTWDFALISTLDGVGINRISNPVAGHLRKNDIMLRLTPTGTELPQAPELVMSNVTGQQILPNQTNIVPGTSELARNVAKVEITLLNPKGFSTTAGAHTLTLSNIPTTLNWNGKLMPSQTAPTVIAGAGMSGQFEITDEIDGSQKCDTLTFLIPAHRGDDFRSKTPTDTTTCKLTVSVKLKMNTPSGDVYYEKGPVEIPFTPKANRRLKVFLIPSEARLEVKSTVVDWDYKQNVIIFE